MVEHVVSCTMYSFGIHTPFGSQGRALVDIRSLMRNGARARVGLDPGTGTGSSIALVALQVGHHRALDSCCR